MFGAIAAVLSRASERHKAAKCRARSTHALRLILSPVLTSAHKNPVASWHEEIATLPAGRLARGAHPAQTRATPRLSGIPAAATPGMAHSASSVPPPPTWKHHIHHQWRVASQKSNLTTRTTQDTATGQCERPCSQRSSRRSRRDRHLGGVLACGAANKRKTGQGHNAVHEGLAGAQRVVEVLAHRQREVQAASKHWHHLPCNVRHMSI